MVSRDLTQYGATSVFNTGGLRRTGAEGSKASTRSLASLRLFAGMTVWTGSIRKAWQLPTFALLLRRKVLRPDGMISDFTKPGDPPCPSTRLLSWFRVRSERSLLVAFGPDRERAAPRSPFSPAAEIFSLFRLYRATKVTNLRVQASSSSRRRV